MDPQGGIGWCRPLAALYVVCWCADGNTPIVAQNDGARTYRAAQLSAALLLAAILGIVLASAVTQAQRLFGLFEIDSRRSMLRDGLYIAWGLPAVLLYVTIRYTFEGLGHTTIR